MSHHIIEARNLAYTYPDGTQALAEVSFRITHGEAVALVGENGAGKSTLLLLLSGCLLPRSGSLQIGDYPLTADTLSYIRRTAGMIFQDPDDQLFMPSVEEDVAFGPQKMGLPAAEVARRVEAALAAVGARHLRLRPPYRLSSGEKRAVAIATVLAMSPNILLLDEPTASLDPKRRRGLIELLKTFTHTKVIATHDLDMALELCPRTILMHAGKVITDGLTSVILNDGALLAKSGMEKPFCLQNTCRSIASSASK